MTKISAFSMLLNVFLLIVTIILLLTQEIEIERAYYRAVWNTCLYGVINQAKSLDHAKSACSGAYRTAIEENWYELEAWPETPE